MNRKAIPRQTVQVTITIVDGRSMAGSIQFDLDMRLSDFVNGPERFLVLRDVKDDLRIINKDHIIDISPVEPD